MTPRMHPRGTRLAWTALLTAALFAVSCGDDETPTQPDPGGGDGGGGPTNGAPVAAAGADLTVSAGLPVTLDASGSSDPDGDALTVSWSLAVPAGSAAALDDASSLTPSFTPDVAGDYVATVTVSDGTDSADDAVTVTAENNTASATVSAAEGGVIQSSDGLLTLTVPAGALAEDTEIRVTRVAEVQIPEAVAGLPGDLTVYDLQPDGTVFSTPVEVAFDVADAVTASAGGAQIAAAFLMSESEGTVESLADVTLVPDDADPTRATLTGGLSHFSHAIFASPSLTFRIEAPDDANVGEPFDATFTLDVSGIPDPIFSAFLENLSAGPVAPDADAVLRADFPPEGPVSVVTNRYVCSEAGDGEVRVWLDFASPPLVALIQLAKTVTCSVPPPPLVTTLIPDLFRVQRLLPIPGSDEEITTGGLVRRVNLTSGAVTELSEADGDPPEWVFALSDGNFLVHTTLGKVRLFVPDLDPQTPPPPPVTFFDQPRHVTPVSENTVALASAFGDLSFMTYTPGGAFGSFQDAFRNLESQTVPQQDPLTNLQAIWVSPDAQTFVGAVTEGDGDSAFEKTQAAILDVDVASGAISVIPLPSVIDFILDTDKRHQFDLDCDILQGSVTSEYLCVFTSGFDSPAATSDPNMDLEGDGYIAIFTVDPFDQTSDLLYWDIGNGYVGASVFPFDGSTTGVAVANQFTGDIDVWHVRNREVAAAFSVSLDGQCPAPIDLILVGFGARGALACQTSTAFYNLLTIQNLDFQKPPTP
ncbi:MAG: PKD domain-containing protein [Longimicrobiales bacterium]|nr:PKD domain-containing protein [Longimicrobiales bacterium]